MDTGLIWDVIERSVEVIRANIWQFEVEERLQIKGASIKIDGGECVFEQSLSLKMVIWTFN